MKAPRVLFWHSDFQIFYVGPKKFEILGNGGHKPFLQWKAHIFTLKKMKIEYQ
jgi:hypothetical protein